MAVIEAMPGADDSAVIELAGRERRIFLTEDADFGQLIYAGGKPAAGVILLRFPTTARTHLPKFLVGIVAEHSDKLSDRFTVVQPGRIRFSK